MYALIPDRITGPRDQMGPAEAGRRFVEGLLTAIAAATSMAGWISWLLPLRLSRRHPAAVFALYTTKGLNASQWANQLFGLPPTGADAWIQ